MFEPVRVLLRRYQLRICQVLNLSPGGVETLPWWQFEQAQRYVDEWLKGGGRDG